MVDASFEFLTSKLYKELRALSRFSNSWEKIPALPKYPRLRGTGALQIAPYADEPGVFSVCNQT